MSDKSDDLVIRISNEPSSETENPAKSGRLRTEIQFARTEQPDNETKQALLREEARTVLDHQVDNLRDVDDVAARTVRITTILIGGVLGVVSLGESQSVSLLNLYLVWGAAYLLLSILLGLQTYNVSDAYYGPGKRVMENWRKKGTRSELLGEMNRRYSEWIDDMEVLEAINGIALDLTQTSLGIGLIYISCGLWLGISAVDAYGVVRQQLVTFQTSLLHVVPLVLILAGEMLLVVYSAWRFKRTPNL